MIDATSFLKEHTIVSSDPHESRMRALYNPCKYLIRTIGRVLGLGCTDFADGIRKI